MTEINNKPATSVVLFEQNAFESFYNNLRDEAQSTPDDLSTDKGRKAIASKAAKIRSEKAGIDRDRKKLTQEWRDLTAQVNGAWKTIESKMDDLAIQIRAPLTDWEESEKKRAEAVASIIATFKEAAVVTFDDTADAVKKRGSMVFETALDAEVFGSSLPDAQAEKDRAVEILKAAFDRLKREEADALELEKLRGAEAERQAKVEAERAKREAKEKAEADAKEAEARKVAAEKEEQERNARIAKEAEEKAKREAERAAQVERERIQREHAEELAAERRRAEAAEAKIKAEREQLEREEFNRKAQADAEAAEQLAREKNRAHRAAVMGAAKESLLAECEGLTEDQAKVIVKAIVGKKIANVAIGF